MKWKVTLAIFLMQLNDPTVNSKFIHVYFNFLIFELLILFLIS